MNSFPYWLLLALPSILIVAVILGWVGRLRRRMRAIVANGEPAIAEVLSVTATGTTINDVPMMRLHLRITQNGVAREVTIKQLVGLGNMPRAGERAVVMVDKNNPDAVFYAQAALGEMAETADLLQDGQNIPKALLENHHYGVATILDIERAGMGPAIRYSLEIDSVVEPKRRVDIEQVILGDQYDIGDRVYLLIGKDDPNLIALAPLSFTDGKKIPRGSNRLDMLVLGPQILHQGKRAEGTVLEASQVRLLVRIPGMPDASRWRLRFRVRPEDPSLPAYDAEQTLSFTLPERARRVCQAGATVPLRYDWNDPMTIVTDPLAMGYPDPYQQVLAAMSEKIAAQADKPQAYQRQADKL